MAENDNQSQQPNPAADYEPYGPEWEAELMKLPKGAIISMYKRSCQEHKREIKSLQRQLSNSITISK